LDIEKFIVALECRIFKLIEERDLGHDKAKLMFDFLRIKQIYPYAMKIYIYVYCCMEEFREKEKNLNIQSSICSVSGQFYSEIRDCRGGISPDLFIKLYETTPFEITRKLSQLENGKSYDDCFDILKTDDNSKVIARFLLVGGFVNNWTSFARWVLKAYPNRDLDNELVLGMVNIICRAGNNGVEFDVDDYKNFLREVLDTKVDEKIKVLLLLKIIGFYREALGGDISLLMSDVIKSLKNLDEEDSVKMMTNFVLKL
jgi:hypothetical protein